MGILIGDLMGTISATFAPKYISDSEYAQRRLLGDEIPGASERSSRQNRRRWIF